MDVVRLRALTQQADLKEAAKTKKRLIKYIVSPATEHNA